MVFYTGPHDAVVERAVEKHEALTGRAPAHVASAPGTWVLIGENVDHFGGVTILGLAGNRAAVAVSPREDDVIAIHADGPYAEPIDATGSLASLADGTIEHPLATRYVGLIQGLIQRQIISRDTAGLDVTITSDFPLGAGLGALYAADAALALALAAENPEVDEPPMRARIAEICSQAVAAHSTLALLRARHTVALRGTPDQVNVVDYADGSVTAAPHPAKLGVRIFSVATELGQPHGEQAERIAEWRGFIDEAVSNFGVSSLRELPDNVDRVVGWVEARRDTGDASAPDPATARQWVQFCETETLRSLATAKALRSRRSNELLTLLNSRSEAHDIETPDALVAQVLEGGAVAARPAAAGTSQAVIAFVPIQDADAFVERFAEEFELVEITPGEPARVER
ncbi:galactokinase [Corynebacterium sp. TA-R-1]|uniref:Galactokinase n=1 Tax=Corynebacterium stercoris TaxID=2943490 RepID=A0ABT1FYE3_9CORY|nr:galactokinase family protein [Corynebacterium stercoris]MCP1386784.1 galactokinase [Corynebacterium stercoris]